MKKGSKKSKEIGRFVKKGSESIEVSYDSSLISCEFIEFKSDCREILWKLFEIMHDIEEGKFSHDGRS